MHDTTVHSVSGQLERRLVTPVQEWRIEHEMDSDGLVISIVSERGEYRSFLIGLLDAQDIGEVLRTKGLPGSVHDEAWRLDTNETAGNALDALLSRRSVSPKRLQAPGPTRGELETLLQAGLRAPDHGRLHPWRIIEFPAGCREHLAQVFEAEKLRRDPLSSSRDRQLAREHALRAPALLAFVVCPRTRSKVPMREQWLCAGAALGNILNAAHQMGYGAIMLSGERCFDPIFTRTLGLLEDEFLAGFISIGSIKTPAPAAETAPPSAVWSIWPDFTDEPRQDWHRATLDPRA
jgi:nitroreductase